MTIDTPIQVGNLTSLEAAELSKLLEERWGVSVTSSQENVVEGDLISDFIVPLMIRQGELLAAPADHLADVRRRLAGRMAA